MALNKITWPDLKKQTSKKIKNRLMICERKTKAGPKIRLKNRRGK